MEIKQNDKQNEICPKEDKQREKKGTKLENKEKNIDLKLTKAVVVLI